MTSQPTVTLEESEILDLLQKQDRPWRDLVAEWKVETGEDSLDDPAIWVWVILKSIKSNQEELEQLDKIDKQVIETIAESGEKRWVYVQFRTKDEQDELEREEQEEFQEVSA